MRLKLLALYLVPLVLFCELVGTIAMKQRGKERGLLEKNYRTQSAIYHHDLKPNVTLQKAFWGPVEYTMATNSLGFRDESAREVPLKSQQYRILFMGDSFTEGVGVDYSKTFPGLAAAYLRPQGIDVLNAGVVSYSPIIYYRKLKHLIEERGLRVNEVVTFIDLSDAQDEIFYRFDANQNVVDDDSELTKAEKERGYDTPRTLKERVMRFLDKRTFYISYLFLSARPVFYGSEVQYGVNQRRAVWTIDENVFETYAKKGLANGALHMDMLHRLLQKHRIKLTVGVYPWPDQIFYWDVNSKQASFWKDWASERGVRFVNAMPQFFGTSVPENKLEIIKKYYIPRDYHFNEAGHQAVANALFEAGIGK